MLRAIQVIYNAQKYQKGENIEDFFEKAEIQSTINHLLYLISSKKRLCDKEIYAQLMHKNLDIVTRDWSTIHKNSADMKSYRIVIDFLENCRILKKTREEDDRGWYEWYWEISLNACDMEFERSRTYLLNLMTEARQKYVDFPFFYCKSCYEKSNKSTKFYDYAELIGNEGKCNCGMPLIELNREEPIKTIQNDILYITSLQKPSVLIHHIVDERKVTVTEPILSTFFISPLFEKIVPYGTACFTKKHRLNISLLKAKFFKSYIGVVRYATT